MVAVQLLVAYSCTKEEYLDKFGEEYMIHTKGLIVPGLEGNKAVADVSYMSYCPDDGASEFTWNFLDNTDMMDGTKVLVLSRAKEICTSSKLEKPVLHREVAAVHIEDDETLSNFKKQQFKFLAMPPDSDYEIYNLESRAPGTTEITARKLQSAPFTVTAEGNLMNIRDADEAADDVDCVPHENTEPLINFGLTSSDYL